MTTELPPLSVAVQTHLQNCETCERNMDKKPVPNLNPKGSNKLCSDLLEIYRRYSEYEGRVNNVVAKDEFGNEA